MSVGYDYTKSPVDIGRLNQEILDEPTITTGLDFSHFDSPDELTVVFTSALSGAEKIALDAVVASHGGDLIPWPAELPTLGAIPEGQLVISDGELSTYWGYDKFTNLADTPSEYDNGKYAMSTISGVVWDDIYATVSGLSIFGSQFCYTYDDLTYSTTSTDFVHKLFLTASGVPTGIYRVGWTYEWAYSSSSAEFICLVKHNDVNVVSHTQTRPAPADITQFNRAGGFKYLDLTAGDHHFDLYYASSSYGKTAVIRQITFEFWRVGECQ